ncbi:MAG: glycosyltransferase family 4 protein [Candidatus Kerfeldbacteria bacterium]
MKIGYVVPYYYPDMGGGIEHYAKHIAEELAALGHDVHVFTQATTAAPAGEETVGGVAVHRIKSIGFFYRLKYWPSLSRQLKRAGCDMLVTFDYAQPQSWQTLRYASVTSTPVAILIYDIQSKKTPRHPFKQFFLALFDRAAAQYVLHGADLLLTRTEATHQWLHEHGISQDKIRLAPPGITDDEMQPGHPDSFRKKYSLTGDIILFLGRIRRQKGIFLLLDAFETVQKQHPQAQLVYVGPDDKEYDGLEFTPQLNEQIKKKQLSNVHILGSLYDQDKTDALAAASVLVLPSSSEAFGQVFIQAMAQGTPVIGTRASGVPYVVSHEQDGFLITPWDGEQLISYMNQLLSDNELRTAMGERGKKKAGRYRYRLLAEQLIKQFKQLQNKDRR